MLRSKNIDRICAVVLACTLLLTCAYMGAAAGGVITADHTIGYETRLFDTSRVHTIDIVMDDWEGFLETCANEEYAPCALVIDGESCGTVAIRAKGNTSLSTVASYGSNRYSFKVEFDHYQSGKSYHGLDKISLNNLIQDKTCLKDYIAYTLMGKMGVAAPLCSFAMIRVNGEDWGLYLAVEAVEQSFLRRNYGTDYGELYKPDSMSFGGGRGNGQGFDMDEFRERLESGEAELPEGVELPEGLELPEGVEMPQDWGNFDFSQDFGGGGMPQQPDQQGAAGEVAGATGEADPSHAGGFDPSQMIGGFDPSQMGDFDPSQMSGGFAPSQPGGMGMNGSISAPEQADAAPEANPDGQSMPEMPAGGMDDARGSSDVKLQYIDDDPASYSNIFDNAKTDVDEDDQQRLIAALQALGQGDSSVVDVESVIAYFAVHDFLCNGDSYTGSMVHNYYLYEDDGVLSMIPWDYNLAFGGFSMGGGAISTVNSPIDSPVSSGDISDRPMVAWIFASEEYTELYHETYARFIDEVFTSGWFAQEFARVTELIAPYVQSDPTAFYSYEEFLSATQALEEFCTLRAQSVQGQLEGTIPSTSAGQNADSSALIDASGLNLSDMGDFNMGGEMGADGMNGGFGMMPGNMPSGTGTMSDGMPEMGGMQVPEGSGTMSDGMLEMGGTQVPEGSGIAPGSMPQMNGGPGGAEGKMPSEDGRQTEE